MKNCITTFGIAFTLALPHGTQAQVVTPPPVPIGIEVPPPDQPFLIGHAFGTQNYECQPVNSLGRVSWVLFTPQATLFDDDNQQLTTHFFSPNPVENSIIIRAAWQDSRDTSIVWAGLVGISDDANFVKAGAVPWLKLEMAGTQDGPTGGGTLSKTTFIQRVNTDGGAAPSTDCDRPTDIGKKAFVPYAADYIFYKK
jgi:hypothetical protein